jgi:uncharacterized membrane protein YvbJ
MVRCSKCQHDNPKGAMFCVECGRKLEIKCQNCGKENLPTHKFCSECGNNFSESVKPSKALELDNPQRYIPKHLADKILETKSSIEGERKLLTVLFADI